MGVVEKSVDGCFHSLKYSLSAVDEKFPVILAFQNLITEPIFSLKQFL